MFYFLQLWSALHLYEHFEIFLRRSFLDHALLVRQGELLLCLHISKMGVIVGSAHFQKKSEKNPPHDDELSGAVQLADRAHLQMRAKLFDISKQITGSADLSVENDDVLGKPSH